MKQTEANQKMMTTIQNFASGAAGHKDEAIMLKVVRILRSEISDTTGPSFFTPDTNVAVLKSWLENLHDEMQTILRTIAELRPCLVTETSTNGLLNTSVDALKEEVKCNRQKSWELRTLQDGTSQLKAKLETLQQGMQRFSKR